MEVGAEKQEVGAGLDLFLIGQLVELLLELLVGNVDDGELLAIVACRGVANGGVDESHLLFGDRLTLVSADAAPLQQGVFYGFHYGIGLN